ncbi:transcriptional regulator GcvA [Trinickia fusca]|uniref:Transcriptional regulator GcvA n=1 Tax=Trinickia fusca TaxID=2419777 RepID=A0A494X6H6_9BURK|nr:transcriptional regulator GcvA [Trinickia fusca]RKP45231.1 transcriptional regulator GcvA [Trinickia fusca]
MRKLPSLNALRAFEAVARHLSMKEAAHEMSVTPTAVSHQIRQLEESIGSPLFERRVRALVLTPQGRALYPVLRDGFDTFAQALQRIREEPQRSHATLTTTAALAARWLAPAVASFQHLHPDIDLRIHASDVALDLAGDGADIAIRYGAGRWPGLVAEHLFDDAYAPVCHPRLAVRQPSDLASHPLIHSQWQPSLRDVPDWRAWVEAAGLALETERGLVFSDETHAIGAAAAGQGVALVNLPLVAPELESGTLVVPFGPVLRRFGFFLVYPEHRREARTTEAVRAWVSTLALPRDIPA